MTYETALKLLALFAVSVTTPVADADAMGRNRLARASPLEGMSYAKARTVILGYGWKPSPGECHGPDVNDRICETYPEIDNCTGVGLGICIMRFTKKDRCLSLQTVGSAPQVDYEGDTAVRQVSFSRGHC